MSSFMQSYGIFDVYKPEVVSGFGVSRGPKVGGVVPNRYMITSGQWGGRLQYSPISGQCRFSRYYFATLGWTGQGRQICIWS